MCPIPIIETVRLGGLLHDLGKIAVPDRVLLKPGPLNREEFAFIRKHPETGAVIVRPLEPFTAPEAVVLHHHERLDGKGYPSGLRGSEIPIAARIVSVSDAFDAITSDRPYRAGKSVDTAMQILQDGRGSQWDPEVVDAFSALYVGFDGRGGREGPEVDDGLAGAAPSDDSPEDPGPPRVSS